MIRVMIIDDEFPALKLAERVLQTFEDVHICGSFSDPEELLTSLRATDIDMVLVDMKMPGMHGLELARLIREIKLDISIVFVTAYDEYSDDAFKLGALDYIMKPITPVQMQKTLEKFYEMISLIKA